MKKLISILLALTMVLSVNTFAFAGNPDEEYKADVLYNLGLLKGSGTNSVNLPEYDLDDIATRNVAVTMLVRLIGKEDEAIKNDYSIPFVDVPGWATQYVGYAYDNKLTSGINKTMFGGNDNISATMYITFLLRALGYSSAEDFEWDKAWEFSDEIGMTNGEFNEENTSITRGNLVILSEKALRTNLKGSSETLFDKLKSEGTIPRDAALELKTENLDYEEKKVDFSRGEKIVTSSDCFSEIIATRLGDGYKFSFATNNQFSTCCPWPAGLQSDSIGKLSKDDKEIFDKWYREVPMEENNGYYSFFIPECYAKYNLPSSGAKRMIVSFRDEGRTCIIDVILEHSSFPE